MMINKIPHLLNFIFEIINVTHYKISDFNYSDFSCVYRLLCLRYMCMILYFCIISIIIVNILSIINKMKRIHEETTSAFIFVCICVNIY